MEQEIERKFFIKEMPDLNQIKPVPYERYYLYHDGTVEMRINKKGEKYELIRKEMISGLSANKVKLEITAAEFERLKQAGEGPIIRDGYTLSHNPEISIKIYYGKHEGLKKVEVEFNSEEEARIFQPLPWFGKEITTSAVSRDAKLLDLSEEEFRAELGKV